MIGRKGAFPTILIVALALVITAAGVGFGLAWRTEYLDKWLPVGVREFFGRHQVSEGEETEQPNEKPNGETPKPAEDETKDWKIYRAEFYEIKYPPNWKIESDAVSPQPDGTFIRSTQFNDDRECEVRFATGGKCGRISIASYSFADWFVEHKFAGQPTTPLAGEEAWIIPYELIEQNNTYVSDMAITYKGKTFEIQLQHFPGYEDYRKTFDLMLSTFKFLE